MIVMVLPVLFVWLDATTHAPTQNPTVAQAVFEPRFPALRELKPRPDPGTSRAMPSLRSIVDFSRRMHPEPATSFLCDRMQLLGNTSLLEDLAYLDGFYSLYFRTEREVHSRLFVSTNEIRSPLADFLGASQITDDRHPLQWLPRRTWLPLITAGQKPVFANAEGALAGVTSAEFAPARIVYLPQEARQAVSVTNHTDARVLSQRFTPHEVSARIRAGEPSLVVLAQNFYRPWRAYVDGQPVPLWQANYSFQAVQVPVGWHELIVRYEDSAFRLGAVISLLTLLGCGWAWVKRCSFAPRKQT